MVFDAIAWIRNATFASPPPEGDVPDCPLDLARCVEEACLQVHAAWCSKDRPSTAAALHRYSRACAAIAQTPEPAQAVLRGLIADRDVVPAAIEQTVAALVDEVHRIPIGVTAVAAQAQHGEAADEKARIRQLECALSLIEIASARCQAAMPSSPRLRAEALSA